MTNEDRLLQTLQIQVERGLPGEAWPTWGSCPVIRQLRKQSSIGVNQLIHSSDVSKQRESAELDNGVKIENCNLDKTIKLHRYNAYI